MKIILVEDEISCIEDFEVTFQRYIEQHNVAGYKYEVAESLEEALSKLDSSFDAAIIDLKLKDNINGGNEVIDRIKNNFRIPIAVLTGTPNNLDFESAPLMKLFTRDEGYDNALDFLVGIFNTGLTQVFGGSGLLEKALRQVFWKSIPESLEHFTPESPYCGLTHKQLLRFAMSHIIEELESTNSQDPSNIAETYIYPSTKLKGGAILIGDNDDIYIVLTPHCDLANNKAEFIQIAKVENIFNLERVQKAVSKHKNNNSKASRKSVEASLDNMVKNKLSRYHYLPKSGPVNVPSVIDFQKLKSVEQNKFSDGYRVVGTVAESFYKDILNRFSINYSRQGSPDYDFENELESLLDQATR